MDLNLPLADLVMKVEGAFGAVLADKEGEAVSVFALPDQPGWDCNVGDDRIKLISAYQTITLRACSQLSRQFATGPVTHLVCRYEGATVVVKALKHDYLLILVMRAQSHPAQGLLYLSKAAELINQDL